MLQVGKGIDHSAFVCIFFPVSGLKPEPKYNIKCIYIDQGKLPLPFPFIAAL